MNIVISVILIVVILFQLSRIKNAILYGDKISIGRDFYIKDLDCLFKIIEQSNPDSIVKVYSGKIPPFKIVKKQDAKKWWLEILVNSKQRNILINIFNKYNYSLKNDYNNPSLKKSKFLCLGCDIKVIVNILTEFYETLGFNLDNSITISLKNFAIEESLTQKVLAQTQNLKL